MDHLDFQLGASQIELSRIGEHQTRHYKNNQT
jgi:hypothetical protein